MKEAFTQSPIIFHQLIILQKYQSNVKLKETSKNTQQKVLVWKVICLGVVFFFLTIYAF